MKKKPLMVPVAQVMQEMTVLLASSVLPSFPEDPLEIVTLATRLAEETASGLRSALEAMQQEDES